MGFGGRVRIAAGVRHEAGASGTTRRATDAAGRRVRTHTTRPAVFAVARRVAVARVVARRRARRAKPKPQEEKRGGRFTRTVRPFIFSMDVVGGGGHGDDTGAAGRLGEKAEALNALTGGAVRNLRSERGMGGQRRVRHFAAASASEKVPMPASRGAASGRETRGEETNLGGGLGGDGGLHAEGRGHGGHGRHDNVRVCVGVSPTESATRKTST